jgi:hypothetical protein
MHHRIEKLTDASNLFDVVMALHLMALEKVEHIETAWQDKATAKPWKKASQALYVSAEKIQGLNI